MEREECVVKKEMIRKAAGVFLMLLAAAFFCCQFRSGSGWGYQMRRMLANIITVQYLPGMAYVENPPSVSFSEWMASQAMQ